MKRALTLALACLQALLCLACTAQPAQEGNALFYYLAPYGELEQLEPLIQTESRQLPPNASLEKQIQTYLYGPLDPSLRSPFPNGVQVVSLSLDENTHVLRLVLSQEYAGLSGLQLSLANACLTWTLTENPAVEQVCVYSENNEGVMNGARYLTRDQFLTEAEAPKQEFSFRLYFADENQRYLIPEVRRVVDTESDSVGVYILHQLMDGPTPGTGTWRTIPQGTRLLGFRVEDGVAQVDFSSEFIENKPATELGERMTIYSVVDSLTELDSIDSVTFLVEGKKLEYYRYMRLSRPLVRDESAIGPVQTGINEFDATLYYQSWSSEFLAAVPTRIRRDDTVSMAERIVRTLIESEPVNDLHNLMPAGTELRSIDTIEGVCYVDLSAEFGQIAGGYSMERLAVNALVASLCSIDSIHSVVLSIEGGAGGMRYYDLSYPIRPLSSWFFPS